MKLPYKYTTIFDATIASCKPIDVNQISKSSIDNLRGLVPTEIDFWENPDLLGVACNAAVVNMFNKNGEGIATDTAKIYTPNFIHKPTNIEHDKAKIVGHILSAGFSSYPDSEPLTAEQVAMLTEAFHIALGCVVYRSANRSFAEMVERSLDPDDPLYRRVSASWEIGYSSYDIAVGSDLLSECTIISDPEEVEALSKYLKTNGGSGFTKDGAKVSRLIKGEIYPFGIGFTVNPAADVAGLISDDVFGGCKKTAESNNNISQKNKIDVKTKKITPMDIEQIIAELKSLLMEKKFSTESVASMTDSFTAAIKERDEKWKADLQSKVDETEALAKEREELKQSVEDLNKKITDAQKEIDDFRAQKAADEAVAKYNERMEELDKEYTLDDDDRAFLAKDLKTVDVSDEAFASYKDRLVVLWKDKNKEAKAKFDEEVEKRVQEKLEEAKASADPKKALAKAKEKEGEQKTPNTTPEDGDKPKSLADKYRDAFSVENETITIS